MIGLFMFDAWDATIYRLYIKDDDDAGSMAGFEKPGQEFAFSLPFAKLAAVLSFVPVFENEGVSCVRFQKLVSVLRNGVPFL
jgi:hypothetical protein